MNSFPLFSIFLAMIVAIISPILKNGKIARSLNMAMLVVVTLFSLGLVSRFWGSTETVTYMMGHFPAPWGNELRFGLFESMMALLFSIIMLLAVVNGLKFAEDDIKSEKLGTYYALLDLLFASMLSLIYTNDIFTAYVFIEINTISACAIVLAKETGDSIRATLRYLIMSLLGSGLFLIAVAILYSITGHLLISSLHDAVAKLEVSGGYLLPLAVSALLITVALSVKSALFPFHTWLADAHSATTTSSSSILSGLVVKSYIILLVKIFYRVYGINFVQNIGLENLIFLMGVGGMMFGSLNAIREKESKRMIAYSSVTQIGYIFMGIGLGTGIGLVAAFFHLISHACTKPLLFAAERGLSDASGHSKKITELRGAGRRNPVAGFAFAVGSLSMVGIPLFAGFMSKWNLGVAALQMETWKMIVALLALAVSTFLNALYYLPVLITIFAQQEKSEASSKSIQIAYVVPVLCYIALNIALGIFGQPILNALGTGFAAML